MHVDRVVAGGQVLELDEAEFVVIRNEFGVHEDLTLEDGDESGGVSLSATNRIHFPVVEINSDEDVGDVLGSAEVEGLGQAFIVEDLQEAAAVGVEVLGDG